MDELLAALRAAAEPTRLRLLALCAESDLTVSELTQILGQSQPRVSRHLKLLCEAGLLDRFREGSWVFYRLAQGGAGAATAGRLLDLIPAVDPTLVRDAERLDQAKRDRADVAAAYFRDNAAQWGRVRSLHADDAVVEEALRRALGRRPLGDLLDIGTGTGRILEVLGPAAERAVGVDASREMLAVARANLEQAGLKHCMVRQADMYHLPFADAAFDAVVIHQVLHFCDKPASVVAEAARVLRPDGQLAVVDFAPHDLESLRAEHNHRRLGFAESEVEAWCAAAGMAPQPAVHLPGHPLTVTIWLSARAGQRNERGAA